MPVFQASTRSKNGVTLTAPRRARSNANSSQSFVAWSRTSTATAAMRPERRREVMTMPKAPACPALTQLVHALSKSTDHHSQRLPFPQRLGVAGRDVGVFGILADGRENLPGARAFDADGFFNDDGDTGYVVQAERARGCAALAYLVVRGDADFGEIDVEQRAEQRLVGDVDDRRGLQRRADALGGAFQFQRAGDDAADVADDFPLRRQRLVAQRLQAVRKQRQMHRRLR